MCVLERNDWFGGAIRTAEITEPGFVHEVFASWHPLFTGSAAYEELGDELHAKGVEYLNTELPTATLFPDGEAVFFSTSHDANVAEFDRHAAGDGEAWARTVESFTANADLAFGLLSTELWSRAGLGLGHEGLPSTWSFGIARIHRRPPRFVPGLDRGDVPLRASPRLFRALGAARGPRPGCSVVGVHGASDRRRAAARGMPIPRGGGVTLVEALVGIVRDAGGTCETEA